MLRNSRTLPGQACRSRAATASGVNRFGFHPLVSPSHLAKYSMSAGTSPFPLPQGRQQDRENVDPVKQVFAKQTFPHMLFEVAMGRDQNPHVDAQGPAAAHTFHFALFENAQQLGLHQERHIADLVEKQRAAAGLFKAAEVP